MEEQIPPLESLFIWFEDTSLGAAVRDSIWAFAVLESIHLIGLALLGGTLLVVDLRMLGVGLTNRKISELAAHARRWLILGIAILIVTGIPLMLSEAIKTYYNTSFWVKIITLPFALAFTFLVRERMAHDEALEVSGKTRLVAVVSIALWFTVAAAGRWIGFS